MTDVAFVAILISSISLTVSAITAYLIARQVRNQSTALSISLFAQVSEQISSPETRANRRVLRENRNSFARIRRDPQATIPPDLEEKGRYIASVYDRLGFILSLNKKFERRFLEWHGDVILDMWEILEPWIRRRWRNEYEMSVRARWKGREISDVEMKQLYKNNFEELGMRAHLREKGILNSK